MLRVVIINIKNFKLWIIIFPHINIIVNPYKYITQWLQLSLQDYSKLDYFQCWFVVNFTIIRILWMCIKFYYPSEEFATQDNEARMQIYIGRLNSSRNRNQVDQSPFVDRIPPIPSTWPDFPEMLHSTPQKLNSHRTLRGIDFPSTVKFPWYLPTTLVGLASVQLTFRSLHNFPSSDSWMYINIEDQLNFCGHSANEPRISD